MLLGLFIQRTDIGFVCFYLGMSRRTVRLELMGTVCGFKCPHTALGNFFQFMSTLHAHIILLGLPDFAVRCSKHGVDRRGSYRMGELGGCFLFHFLKVQFYRHLAILAHNTLFAFDGFLRDF